MHPLIRVTCFLVFAAWLALGGPGRLWCGAALMVLAYALMPAASLRPALAMSYRLRWFFLSLLIVYGWFTPGSPLWADPGSRLAALLPSPEGLGAGLARALALVLIVFAVNLLLRSSSRDELLAAVYGLARPLAACGLSRERLALRMVLVMEALDGTRALVKGRLAERPRGVPGLRAIGRFVSELLREVIARAEQRPGEGISLMLGGPPPALQWSYPVLLGLLLFAAGRAAWPF